MPAVLLAICRQQYHQGSFPSASIQGQQGVTHCLLERTLSLSAWLRIEEDERRGEVGGAVTGLVPAPQLVTKAVADSSGLLQLSEET